MGDPQASVIVLAHNGVDFLGPCLEAVFRQGYASAEVIVVDNASTDGSANLVAERFPQARLIRNQYNLGFSGGNNLGLQAATGDVLVVLNQDTVVQPHWLAALVAAVEDPMVGLAGCKILYPDGKTLQHAGGYLILPVAEAMHYGIGEPDEGQYDEVREVEYLTGAALAMRREVFEMLGGFDERFSPGYYEDVDLCRRAYEAGLRVLYVPSAVLYHHEGSSFKQGLCDARYLRFRNRIRFVFKHFPVDQILGAFIPAMTQGLARRRPEELRAVARGSLDAMLIWPEVAPQHLDCATKRRVVQAFRELRDRAVYLEITPKA